MVKKKFRMSNWSK